MDPALLDLSEFAVHRPTTRASAVVGALALVVALTALTVGSSSAGAEIRCRAELVTGSSIGRVQPFFLQVASSGDGSTVVVQSNDNTNGLNPSFNKELFAIDTGTGAFEAITDSPLLSAASGDAAVDRDGDRVAFLSDANLAGDNADGSQEVFLDVAGTTTQITDTATGGILRPPTISGDGTRVAFESTYDLDGSNTEGNPEIFVHTVGGSTVAVTDGGDLSTFSSHPSFSDDGSRLAFSSNGDPTGGNADLNAEIFRHTIGGSTVQVTNTTGGSGAANVKPDLDADGDVVAFFSNRDLETGQNPFADGTIVVHTIGSGSFDQVANSVPTDAQPPAIGGDGSTVVFASIQNVGPSNPDSTRELWFHDRADGSTHQLTVTATAGSVRQASIDLAGRTPIFGAAFDPSGVNPGSQLQVFRSACVEQAFTDVSPNHPFFEEIEWMASEGISTGFQPGPTYRPGAAVSRAAMSAFMFRLAGSPPFTAPGTPTFGDVSTSHPFYDEIEWMADEGITTGTPASPKPLYKPAAAVSRGAMSAFMFRLAGSPPFGAPPTPTFVDVGAGHPFFTEIEWMADEEITTGFQPGPTYRPGAAVSRQAMSAFMFRLADGPGVDLTD